MASGRLHSLATLSAATCFLVNFEPMMAAGCFLGLVLTPDLDVDEGSLSQYFVRGVNSVAEKVWWLYWKPYRKVMSHRSFMSHFPVVSTAIRLIYLFWWLFAAGYQFPPAFLSGIVAADTIHWLMDFRMFRKIWK